MLTQYRETTTFMPSGSRDFAAVGKGRIASRSSWFVPLVGIFMTVFCLVASACESASVVYLTDLSVGVSLVMYRLWSPSSKVRSFVLAGELALVVGSLVVQVFAFATERSTSPTLWNWFGSSSVAGLVMSSLSLLFLLYILVDEIPAVCHNPSRLRFWRVPLVPRVCTFASLSSVVVLFNPSLLSLPYLVPLLFSSYHLTRGGSVETSLFGRKECARVILGYSIFMGAVAYILSLPPIRTQVASVPWLPGLIGIPANAPVSLAVSFSSVFLLIVVAPWWTQLEPPKQSRLHPRRSQTTTRVEPVTTAHSPPPAPQLRTTTGSSLGSHSGHDLSPEKPEIDPITEEPPMTGANAWSWWGVLVLNEIIFPVVLIVPSLLLPSTLMTPLLLAGLLSIAAPARVKQQDILLALQTYVSVFIVAVTLTTCIYQTTLRDDTARFAMEGIGLIPANMSSDSWNQFWLLFALFLVLIVLQLSVSLPLQGGGGTHSKSLWIQGIVGFLQSRELGFGLVIAVVFTACAVNQQSSVFFITYTLIALLPLVVSHSHEFAPWILVFSATAFAAATSVYQAWTLDSKPASEWTADIGLTPANFYVPHVAVVVVASLRIRLADSNTCDAVAAMRSQFKSHPLVWSRLALVVPMILSLVLFIEEPFDYFSALVVLCFVIQMALLQEGGGNSKGEQTMYFAILRVNVLQLILLSLTLLWILVSMLSSVNSRLISALSGNAYITPSELGVLSHAQYLGKLCVVVSLLVTCSLVLRFQSFVIHTHIRDLRSDAPTNDTGFTWKQHLLIVTSWQLPRLLMFVIFLASVYQTTFINTAAELVICVVLIIGKKWRQVGAVFSVLSMLLMFLQYLAAFSLIESSANPELLQYLGLTWSSGAMCRNLVIFGACIFQRNVQHLVKLQFNSKQRQDPYFVSLDKFAEIVIALVLLLAAAGRANFFSVIYVVLAIVLLVKQSFNPVKVSLWTLRTLAVLVATCVAVQLLLRIWFPPTCSNWCRDRPSFAPLCPTENGGDATTVCLDDWQRYFNSPLSVHGDTALTQSVAVATSIAQSLGLIATDSSIAASGIVNSVQYTEFVNAFANDSTDTPTLPSTTDSAPATYTASLLQGYATLWDFFVLWTICVLTQNHLLMRRKQQSTSGDLRERSNDSTTSSSRPRKLWSSLLVALARVWIQIVHLLAVLSCFTFRDTVDLFSLAFIPWTILLFWSQEKQIAVRRRVVIAGIVIATTVVGAALAYQLPVFPCKYWYASCLATGPAAGATNTSPWDVPTVMCVDLQKSVQGCENFGAFTWRQIAMQTVGLMKSGFSFAASPFPMTIGPPILLLLALLVQLALMDHSNSYARVDAYWFQREKELRFARSRRLVAEFNASLLIRNRRVKCALEATRRKLVRVQQSADRILSRFYTRQPALGGDSEGEVHLSSEVETICSRGYSEEEAVIASALSTDQPEGTALLLLETAAKFGTGAAQETQVVLHCQAILENHADTDLAEDPPAAGGRTWKENLYWMFTKLKSVVASWVFDIPFLQDTFGAEPLSLHRRNDGLLTLIVKALYSNSLAFVVFASVLGFVSTNSLLDLIRVVVILFTIPSWPFASPNVWRTLLVYTSLQLVLKSVIQLPLFCGGGNSAWRFHQGSQGYIPPCPAPTSVGWDIVFGISKQFGSGALSQLETTSLLGVIWQDLLVLCSLLLYRSFLYKCGIWEHLRTGDIAKDSGSIIVPKGRETVVEDGAVGALPAMFSEDENDAVDADDISSGASDEDDDGISLRTTNRSVEDGIIAEQEPPISVHPMPGSFIDLNGIALDATDRATVSRYAVMRHMGCEDVLARLQLDSAPVDNVTIDSSPILQLVDIYRHLRWDAQGEYANHECLRLSLEERLGNNQAVQRGISQLSWLGKVYVKVNPFYAAKVGVDTYTWLFTIALMMFFHVIVFYPAMTDSSASDFISALKRSQFSAGLALLMFFHFVLIVLDRAYYIASFRRSSGAAASSRLTNFRPPSRQQVLWYFLRVLLLITLTTVLHAVMMNSLLSEKTPTTYTPLIQNPALSVYYLEFMLYLVVSVVQLKEGLPRTMQESLRPEQTYHPVTDKIQEIRFMIYRAIPFLDELRVLIDWTVSQSCLDLFQYFKLEDAHTYMWQTKRDMEIRKKMWPAEPIGKAEKGFMGFGLLLLLMLVIIGPVLLFSTLVSGGTEAPITMGELRVTVVAQASDSLGVTSRSQLQIYLAAPTSIETLTSTEITTLLPALTLQPGSTVQSVVFGKMSDYAIQSSLERFAAMQSATTNAVMLGITVSLSITRESANGILNVPETTLYMPSCACKPGFTALCMGCVGYSTQNTSDSYVSAQFDSMAEAVGAVLNSSNSSVGYFPRIIAPVFQADNGGNIDQYTSAANASFALAQVNQTTFAANWTDTCGGLAYAGVCPGVDTANLVFNGTDNVFYFILTTVYSADATGGALLSIGIITVYITIVYAIGRFLRLVFDKESLRVIYLEIPRPDDFLDLATGAATARHYKDLPMEFRLWNCLMKVLRSPETLIALGGSDLTGFGAGRHDDPPHPDLLTEEEREHLRRRKKKGKRTGI